MEHVTCYTGTEERDGFASESLQAKERTRSTKQILTEYQAKHVAILFPNGKGPSSPVTYFHKSFIFLKPQVNFQTETKLKLALGVHHYSSQTWQAACKKH